MINAGRMNRQITIEQRTDTRAASGAVVPTWAAYVTTYAEVAFTGGKEFAAAKQAHSEVDTVFIIRSGGTVTNRMRVNYQQRFFDILAVDDITDKDRVRLICREGQRQGS